MPKSWFLYIALCSDNTHYIGISPDVKKRIKTHNSGKASLYTRGRRPLKLVYTERFKNRSEATKREIELKKWNKKKKEELATS